MNARNFIAAAMLIATATAFAAESPEAASTAGSTAAGTVAASAGAAQGSQPPARNDVKEDTADVVKHYKTPLAIQLDQYKN